MKRINLETLWLCARGKLRGIQFIYFILIWFPLSLFAAPAFQVGKDYQILSQSTPVQAGQKITVVEFFSYGCPWCFKLEPVLDAWKKPANVDFSRVPMAFESGWTILARAYYMAEGLGVEPKLTPILFNAIHVNNQTIDDPKTLAALFAQAGVSQANFDAAYSHAPSVDAQMAQGEALATQDQIYAIPAFVINGQYKTDLEMSSGDPKRLMDVVSYLIQLSETKQ